MTKINSNINEIIYENSFQHLEYLIQEYKSKNKNNDIISLSIGDVSLPIIEPIVNAMHKAIDELKNTKTFKGYGAYTGYDFLKETILKNEYQNFNFTKDEIYISNGAKTDTTSILELFDINSKICVANPMYPIYKNGASCLNRKIHILNATEDNDFMPEIPDKIFDIIYICSPNNPTGIAYSKEYLEKWIKYANKYKSIILYDNVYCDFIKSKNKIKSIYEITNAKNVAIEFRSFSKKASFTGIRCSYYVIPNNIHKDINKIWKKRIINRFNGTDYIAQKGAEATYEKEAKLIIQKNIKYYQNNAKILRNTFIKLGFKTWGGIDSPYIWIKTPEKMTSWQTFDFFLKELNILIVPGIIFGKNGDNYFRISSLGKKEDIEKAIKRINDYYEKNK